MTTEITALLKEKAITASDRAVTINNIKSWYGVEKTFKLSENPPMNIMINGSPTINNFPIKLLIHEFEKRNKSDNIEDIANEFLDFLGKTVPKTDIDNYINDKIDKFKIIQTDIADLKYDKHITGNSKRDLEIPEFIGNHYDARFEEMIPKEVSESEKENLKLTLKKVFCQYLITLSTGIVITGINNSDYFPSYIHLILS